MPTTSILQQRGYRTRRSDLIVRARADRRYRLGYALGITSFAAALVSVVLAFSVYPSLTIPGPAVALVGDFDTPPTTLQPKNIEMASDVRWGALFAASSDGINLTQQIGGRATGSGTAGRMSATSSPAVSRLNDHGLDSAARTAALEALFDPTVVAVIGHSRSATTEAALDYYLAARFPVLLPIATSTRINLDALGNAIIFRLPPNDALQAEAIAAAAARATEQTRNVDAPILIVYSDDAYGTPLAWAVYRRLLTDAPVLPPVPLDPAGRLPAELLSGRLNPSALVVCGYHQQAILAAAWFRTFSRSPLLLSDGAVNPAIFDYASPFLWQNAHFFFPEMNTAVSPDQFESALTSWIRDSPEPIPQDLPERLRRLPSYFYYGVDSMLLLSSAISHVWTARTPERKFPIVGWPQANAVRVGNLLTKGFRAGPVVGLAGTYVYLGPGERSDARFVQYHYVPATPVSPSAEAHLEKDH